MKMKNKILIFAAALSSLLLFTPKIEGKCLENIANEKSKKSCLKEIGIFTGFGSGRISEQGKKYSVVQTYGKFGYDLGEFFGKENLKNKLFFDIEPFLNYVTRPNPNIEAGFAFLLRYKMPLTKKISPYAEAGVGEIYSTQHVHEQSTQLNFATYRGVGLSFFNKKKDAAVSIGYRHRHYSNASTKLPNGGVDTDSIVFGFFF